MKAYTYLLIDLGCILVPFIASFYSKHAFYKEWRYFFPANFIVAALFIIWDYFFTEAGFWGFNPDYLTGIYLANLPIEEVLFFISIPYACLFTFFALKFLIKKNPLEKAHTYISIVLGGFLLLVGLLSTDKWYTALTFLLMAPYLFYLVWKKRDLSFWYLGYLLILPFFLLSNGILTGTGLESPIVWYNDLENLGIRIGTIPVEDSIYGMLLIFLNINLYLYFKKKSTIDLSIDKQI